MSQSLLGSFQQTFWGNILPPTSGIHLSKDYNFELYHCGNNISHVKLEPGA